MTRHGPYRLVRFWGASLLVLVMLSACWSPAAARLSSAGKSIHLPAIWRLLALQNGDFESGETAWQYTSSGYHIILNKAGLSGITPHSGDWAVWMGGAWNETDTLTQSVSIFPGATYLVYWRWILSEETNCGADYTRVLVNGMVLKQDPLCVTTTEAGWSSHWIDLHAYSGSAITLQFMAHTDNRQASDSNSSLYLDDISLQAAAPAP